MRTNAEIFEQVAQRSAERATRAGRERLAYQCNRSCEACCLECLSTREAILKYCKDCAPPDVPRRSIVKTYLFLRDSTIFASRSTIQKRLLRLRGIAFRP